MTDLITSMGPAIMSVHARQAQQFPFCLGFFELLGPTNNLSTRLQLIALLCDQQLRVTNDVDEKDVTDLKLHV